MLEVLRALRALFETSGRNALFASIYNSPDIIRKVNTTLPVVIDFTLSEVSAEIQTEALATLQAVIRAINDVTELAKFLPGVASSLLKLLSKPAIHKTRVLTQGILTLESIVCRVMSDMEVSLRVKRFEKSGKQGSREDPYTPEWLSHTKEQMKIVMATVLKLRTSGSEDVRDALEKFCLMTVNDCLRSLENCRPMLVETAIVLMERSRLSSSNGRTFPRLADLVDFYPEIAEQIKSSAIEWLEGLPDIALQGDEARQKRSIAFLANAQKTLVSACQTSAYLNGLIIDALYNILEGEGSAANSSQAVLLDSEDIDAIETTTKTLIAQRKDGENSHLFQPIALPHESQRETREMIVTLLGSLGDYWDRSKAADEIYQDLEWNRRSSHFACCWLIFKLLQSALDSSEDLNMWLAPPDEKTHDIAHPEKVLQELYENCVYLLSHAFSKGFDWKTLALALEIVEYTARRTGEEFVREFVNVLFPITSLLGHEHPQVRRNALITLNSLVLHCGYKDVSELIVSNADYVVDDLGFHLRSMDFSPAMINVLIMTTRLSGPKVIPYLDDLVGDIFAALDNYHGYPALVEGLFSALREIVDQGAKAETLLLVEGEESSRVDHRKKRAPQITMEDVQKEIEEREVKRQRREEEDKKIDEQIKKGHPKMPWAELGKEETGRRITKLLDDSEQPEEGSTSGQDEKETGNDAVAPEGDAEEEVKKEKSSAYKTLTRISKLAQHYLTFPSPTLRKQLLGLVATAASALASDPDMFLPLVNEIWPVTVARLYDSEGFVTIAACETLSALCVNAGDFLTSRFKTEWKNGMHKWCLNAKEQASKSTGKRGTGTGGLITTIDSSNTGILVPLGDGKVLEPKKDSPEDAATQLEISGGLGSYALAVKVWDAVVDLLVAIVGHVSIPDDMFDDILELLADLVHKRPDVKEVLDVVNADAVWLALYERGEVEWKPTPQIEGWEFVPMTKGIGYTGPDKADDAKGKQKEREE